MDPMKLARTVAYAMSNDVRDARWQLLRKLTPEEALFLLELHLDLQSVGDMNWQESLANRLERGQHHVGRHHDIDDPEEAQEAANYMADSMRKMSQRRHEMFREPVTIERLQKAEDLLASKGIELKLIDRGQIPKEIPLN